MGQGQARLLFGFPEDTILRAFFVFKFAADADPFIMVQVIFLFDPVQHQVAPISLNIA